MLAVCAKISKHSFLHLDIYSPRHFAYRSLLQRLSKSYIKNVQVSHMTTGLLYVCLCVCLCYMIFLATLLSVKILGPSLAGGGRQWHCFGFDCRWWLLNVMCKTLLPYCIEGNTAWLRYRYLNISVEKDRVLGLELGNWQMNFGSPINVNVIPFGLILVRKVSVDHMALSGSSVLHDDHSDSGIWSCLDVLFCFISESVFASTILTLFLCLCNTYWYLEWQSVQHCTCSGLLWLFLVYNFDISVQNVVGILIGNALIL